MFCRIGLLVLLLLTISPALPIMAQGGDDACPALVETALEAVGDACQGLGRNEACYGYNRVDAIFWEEQAENVFAQPADRVPLISLQSVVTAPLSLDEDEWGMALLHLQANVPDALPGQAVTFLLMGDATLENAVPPDEVASPVTPVEATVTAGANLRGGPGITFNVANSVAAGTTLQLIGVNEGGDWHEVEMADGWNAWVFTDLVTADVDELATLPVTHGRDVPPRYAPMQAFYFSAELGELSCREAPSALVVQSPVAVEVSLNVNGLEVTLGSTAVFTMAELSNGTRVLVGALLEGDMTARFGSVIDTTMIGAGDAFGVTLNDAGRVDADSELVDLAAEQDIGDLVGSVVQNACQNANETGVLARTLTALTCRRAMVYVMPTVVPATTTSVDEGTTQTTDTSATSSDGTCTVTASNNVNLRGGPGTDYPGQGQLALGQSVAPDGQATGENGFVWWRLSDGNWLRSDLVSVAGACGGVAVVDAPASSEPGATVPGGSDGDGGSSSIMTRVDLWVCERLGSMTVAAGQPLTFSIGFGEWPDANHAAAIRETASSSLSVDGVSATFTGFGPVGGFELGGGRANGFLAWFDFGSVAPGPHVVQGNSTHAGGYPDINGITRSHSRSGGCTIVAQ